MSENTTPTAPATLPTPAPRTNTETESFWEATRDDVLTLQRCTNCNTVIWWPRAICPECSSFDLEQFAASGNGTVYSYTIVRKGPGRWRDGSPYVLAYVELDEGPRIMTNVVDCDPETVTIDMAVRLAWAETEEGTKLPRFTPA